MDVKEYCCEAMAMANMQRQIVWSSDEDCGWVIKCDAFTDALVDITHCPWCGDRLPTEEK